MSTPRIARIEIAKQATKFSAAHFTIFNAEEREDLHGHNFAVECHLTAPVGDDGLMFDYAIIKRTLQSLVDEIDEKTLMPQNSPHLQFEEDGDYVVVIFNGERIPFLPRDILLLPIANTTVEDFAHYFLDKVINHPSFADRGVSAVTIKVSSSPGQAGCAEWEAS